MPLSRREFLKGVAGAGGLTLLAPTLGCGGGERKRLRPVRGDGSHPFHYIEHVVVVQMENRSFDHYFGALSLVEGRSDVEGLREGMSNPDLLGRLVAPRHLAEEFVFEPDPPHSHSSALSQWNEGRNDGFVRRFQESELDGDPEDPRAELVMGYYDRSQLWAYYLLADAFTLCQRWHASLLAPTWPNRYFSHCATSGGHWRNREVIDAPTPYGFLLDAGGEAVSFNANLIGFFANLESLPGALRAGTPISEYFARAEAGTLPQVSVVEADFALSDDHPPQDIRQGQIFVASVYEALRRSPNWDRSLFVVFYDEHGGFHDHVPPPKAAGETRSDEGFDQLGFRVPALLAGPLVRRGFVLDTLVDHASLPSLISRIFELPHVNERSRLAGDLADALDIALVDPALRPEPVALPGASVPASAMAQSLSAPFGQPELLAYAIEQGFVPRDHRALRRRYLRDYLRATERLGSLHIRGDLAHVIDPADLPRPG